MCSLHHRCILIVAPTAIRCSNTSGKPQPGAAAQPFPGLALAGYLVITGCCCVYGHHWCNVQSLQNGILFYSKLTSALNQ